MWWPAAPTHISSTTGRRALCVQEPQSGCFAWRWLSPTSYSPDTPAHKAPGPGSGAPSRYFIINSSYSSSCHCPQLGCPRDRQQPWARDSPPPYPSLPWALPRPSRASPSLHSRRPLPNTRGGGSRISPGPIRLAGAGGGAREAWLQTPGLCAVALAGPRTHDPAHHTLWALGRGSVARQ